MSFGGKHEAAVRRGRLLIGAVSLLCLVLCGACASVPADDRPVASPVPNRDAILTQLADIIAGSIKRKDSDNPVFHGCFDWHSAVHGHWALLRIARVTGEHGDEALAVAQAFDSQKIEREAAILRDRPTFEMPYGRAWFLRLAIEHELWCREKKRDDAERLRSMADEVAASLLAYYGKRAPSPSSRDYANDSWTLVQLHAYLTHRNDAAGLEVVSKMLSEQFLGNQTALRFSLDRERPDFFSCFGNWAYLIAQTQDADTLETFLKAHPISDEEIRPVDSLKRQVHHLGINWSRAWALRELSRKTKDESERQRFEQAFLKHVETGMEHHRKYAGDYAAYDHWVPQFAVYALTD